MMFLFSGALLALFSAFLFGISPVLIKLFSGAMPPVFMAGILYLGSGIGLLTFRAILRETIFSNLWALPRKQKFQLAGAIIFGGVLAPICLTYGIVYSPAFQVSALLNLETVATTLIAWFIFHEHVGKRVWFGKILIVFGSLLISVGQSNSFFSVPAIFIALACFFWGMDNNLTRDIEDIPPSVLAGIKGLSAGLFNILLAWILHQTAYGISGIAFTFVLGALSYGLSLVLFVYALRKIGSSRTSTYFATGPFIGMLAAVAFLGERPPLLHWIAAIFMLGGIYALYRENHDHPHTHEPQTHSHLHVHDKHHQHKHQGTEGREPHDHVHVHNLLTHSHGHLPDTHHRHRH